MTIRRLPTAGPRAMLLPLATLLAMVAAFERAWAEQVDDFESYREQIREWGMTEGAWQSLKFIAAIRTGGAVLQVRRDPDSGGLGRSYMTTTCPLPGADPASARAWTDSIEAVTEEDVRALRPYADEDESGFVSTAEGAALRDLLEAGYVAAAVEKEMGMDRQALAQAPAGTRRPSIR